MSSTSDRRARPAVLIVGGVIVAAAALFALWTYVISPLLSGDDDDVTAPTPTTQTEVAAGDDAEDGSEEIPEAPLEEEINPFEGLGAEPVPETFEVFSARDPFQQLVVESTAQDGEDASAVLVDPTEIDVTVPIIIDSGQGGGDGTDGDTADDDGGGDPENGATIDETDEGGVGTQSAPRPVPVPAAAPVAPAPPPAAPAPAPVAPAPPAEPEPSGTEVVLRDVFSGSDQIPTLIVAVDDLTYEVREGDVFADRFQVLTIDGTCVTFLFGDSRFALCEGESVIR